MRIRHPEPNGSRWATPPSLIQQRPGQSRETTRYNYPHFETSFLAQIDELDLEHLTRSDAEITARSELQNELENLRATLSTIEAKMDDLLELRHIAKAKKKLEELDQKSKELAATIKTKEEKLQSLASEVKAFYQSRDEITALVARLQNKNADKDDLYRLRTQVNTKLKSLVNAIYLASVGTKRKPKWQLPRKLLPVLMPDEGAERFFLVAFKNGESKIILPDVDPFDGDEIFSSAPEIFASAAE